jgi:hypothetical protein
MNPIDNASKRDMKILWAVAGAFLCAHLVLLFVLK